MKKYIGVIVVVMLIAGTAVLAVGCGEKKEESDLDTPQGAISFIKDANKVTISGEGGTEEWSVEKITEDELGIPFPDDAEFDEANTGKLTITVDGKKEVWAAATLWSDETVSAVTQWYSGELEDEDGYQDQSVNMDGSEIGMFSLGSGDDLKAVLITAGQKGDPGASMITVVSKTGSIAK
ncbi:MAG: hypothetical protein JW738_04795 [Actinobacteria bacterium]|nr:hypothetical protein [Actinomycetota bacterium]